MGYLIGNMAESHGDLCDLRNISTVLLKLHSHFSVIWRFCRISVISEFSFLGEGLKTKTRKSRKISIFRSAKFKYSGPVFRSLF